MDLMNIHSNKIYKEMVEGISSLPIDRADVQRAEEFFDFSKDMDLSILENVNHYDFENVNGSSSANVMYNLVREDDKEYGDRYVLFLDAMGGNTIGRCLSYNFEGVYIQNTHFAYRILNAFNRKYDKQQSKMKVMAIVAQNDVNNIVSQYLIRNAKTESELFYQAGKNYCNSQYDNAKLKLYAYALAYTKPEEKQNFLDKLKSLVISSPESDAIKDMTETVLANAEYHINDSDIMKFLMPIMFMSMNHSEKIKNFLQGYIKGKEMQFLKTLYTNVPISYFEDNVDKVFEMAVEGHVDGYATDCIKQAVKYAWKVQENGQKAEIMLHGFAKRYPKQFIYVMTLNEEIKMQNNGPYYFNQPTADYYSSFYDLMYNILKKENPKAVNDEKLDFNQGMLNFAITEEIEKSHIARDEIREYLTGEKDISVLEPYFDTLEGNFQSGNNYYSRYTNISRNIDTCAKKIGFFKRKYLALKAIQCPSLVPSTVNHFYDNKDELVIDELIEEKVPAEYRFKAYEEIDNNLWYDRKKSFEDFVVKKMVHLRSEEYDSVCVNGGVFTRKVYVYYLGKYFEYIKKDETIEKIFFMFGDSSKEVRKAVVDAMAKNKEYEEKVINCLQAKKLAVRETAVDVLASWGAENYRDVLLKVLETEKSKKLVEKIQTLLAVSVAVDGDKPVSVSTIVADIHKGGRSRQLSWLYDNANFTEVHFANGTVADEKYVQAVMLCYAGMGKLGVNENAKILAKDLNKDDLNAVALEVFEKWVSFGADTKRKWVLYFSLIHGGYDVQELALKYIKEWAEASRGAIAAEAVRALAMNGSSTALMAVDNMAHKFKQRQVKNAAIEAMSKAAEELGITTEELGDKIVPDLEFDENMERVFDYGTRKFKVYLTPSLEVEVFDESDKKLKNMPAPAKKDDEVLAKKSNAEFKQMKKQLKSVITIQKTRLETALLADRRWTVTAWKDLFVKNPVMHSFAIGLIWSAYENNELLQTFRYMEDGSFNTCDEDEYELSENCMIGLAHPINLDEETLTAWKEQLSDYEVIQPIEQLERQVYRVKEDEIGQKTLMRYRDRKINDFTLLGRIVKLGWQKGTVLDAGCFSTFYREDITERIKNPDGTVTLKGNAVVVNISPMYISGIGEEVEVGEVRFYKPENVQKEIDDDIKEKYALKLEDVNERYFSEIVNQLEKIFE